MVFGYFCHLISLGLTAFGLVVLEAFTPRPQRGRIGTTFLGFLPLLPLAALYLGLMQRGGGGLAPEWKHLDHLLSAKSWINQLTWVDPISLARKDYLPILESTSAHQAFAPVVWMGLALGLLSIPSAFRSNATRGWWVLGSALILGGLLGPDTLGATHGEYLQQRVVLLGLAALVPVLPLERKCGIARLTRLAILVAFVLQTAIVHDYARWSDRTAGAILRAHRNLGSGERFGTLLNDIKSPFRSNPLLHADCGLGVGTGKIIWANYETRYYYFPVQFREGLDHPDSLDFERVALSDDPVERRRLWSALMKRHGSTIDALIVWGTEPAIDADNARDFQTIYNQQNVRILARIPRSP